MFSWVGRQRRLNRVVAVAAVGTLVSAGAAFAWHGFTSASSVTATFSANTVANSQTQTCTASNNDSIQVTEATFSGTASSTNDANLNGPITIDATSVFDTTTNAGTLTGQVNIGNTTATPPAGFEGRLIVVNVGGHLQGLLVGKEASGGTVLGNVTSTFSTSAGFGSSGSPATIGTGTGANTAIVSTSSCAPSSNHGDDDQGDDDQGDDDQGQNHAFDTNTNSLAHTFAKTTFNNDHHGSGDHRG
jgi:hypothetical protein